MSQSGVWGSEFAVSPVVAAAARDLAHGAGRRFLGIAGAPASGKSTLAQYLASALAEDAVCVPMDGFHLSQRELQRLGRANRKGAPDTFDVAGYRDLLVRIARAYGSDETVHAPDFYRELEEPIAASIAVDSATPLVITEGNYLLLDDGAWADIAPLLDEVWFVHVETARREYWLAARHQRYGRSEDEAWAWVEATDRPNAMRIEANAGRANRHLIWDGAMLRFANAEEC